MKTSLNLAIGARKVLFCETTKTAGIRVVAQGSSNWSTILHLESAKPDALGDLSWIEQDTIYFDRNTARGQRGRHVRVQRRRALGGQRGDLRDPHSNETLCEAMLLLAIDHDRITKELNRTKEALEKATSEGD